METHQVNNERPRYTLLILYANRRIPRALSPQHFQRREHTSKVTDLAVYSQRLPCPKFTFNDLERPTEFEEATVLVPKEELQFSMLTESPDSEEGTDFGRDSVSTRSTSSLEDVDTQLHLIALTSPPVRCIGSPMIVSLKPWFQGLKPHFQRTC
jgi:hypothetical protein